MLEGAGGIATKVAIRAGMFCNESWINARADVIGEQVAGSLRELQEEVEVLKRHSMIWCSP